MNLLRFSVLALVLLACSAPAWACKEVSRSAMLDFQGSVSTGQPYSYTISKDYALSFRLIPNDHGWTMEIEDAKGNDMIYPVTPPYRFNSLQSFDGSYGANVQQDEVRHFKFLYGLKPDGYDYVQTHLENILWPMAEGDQEEGLKALDLFPQGQGQIMILDAETTQPAPDSQSRMETVNMMQFKIHLVAPDGYHFDIPQKCH